MKQIWGTTKKILCSIVGMLVLFSVPSSLVPVGYATGGHPEYVLFTRTEFFQDWVDTEIAAANGATVDNMGVTLQVFMKGYHYDPTGGDHVELGVLAFAVDRDSDIRDLSSYIVKELKITLKKMSIENDNGFDLYDVYTWTGNYFINDDKASIDTQIWRNYNLSMQPKEEADWVYELILAGAFGAIGTVISDLALGIAYSVATEIAELGLGALKEKESIYCDDESLPEEYEPAFYKGTNDDPMSKGLFGFSDAALGGEVTWRLYDDCTMNHRLEIIAELTYAQYRWDYGYWFDEHTVRTSVSVSAVRGDGYGLSCDYRTVGSTQYPGSAIDEGYDAPSSRSTANPTIYPGTLYYDFVSPEGEVDPYAERLEHSYSGYLTDDYDEHDWYKVYILYNSHYEDNSAYIRLDVPEGADFDLRVYNSASGVNYYSTKGGSVTDEVIIPISEPSPLTLLH